MTREELMALVSDYVIGQASNPSWFYTTSPAELETLYKDYIKSQNELKTSYDTVVNKYSVLNQSDPIVRKMFNYFSQISNKQLTAADIIDADKDIGALTPGQKQDLETYEDEMYAREKAVMEIEAEQRANAEIYGLPSPDASPYIPPLEMLEGLMPTQKGGMTELATSQRWQRDAQKKYADALAAYNAIVAGENVPGDGRQAGGSFSSTGTAPVVPVVGRQPGGQFGVTGGAPVTPVESGRQPDGSFVRPNARIIGERTTGRVGGIKPEGRVGGSRTSNKKETDEKKKEALWARNTAYTMNRAAEMRVQQDASFTERLANEIARQMVEKYGTPYEVAVKRGRELAEEQAMMKSGIPPDASGRSTGVKPAGGGGGLSEWEKEQERKRRLFEGRGI